MNSHDMVFLGVKARVMALSKRDGSVVWSTELASGMGQGFVTVLSDQARVFAHTHGKLHCLDVATGRVLWTNELPGCGYGIASLNFPGGAASPDPGAVQQIIASQQQAGANASAPSVVP